MKIELSVNFSKEPVIVLKPETHEESKFLETLHKKYRQKDYKIALGASFVGKHCELEAMSVAPIKV